jgi:hypothetical protein
MNIYYTYAYLREDGTPYYIGKGKDNRAWSSHGKWTPVPPNNRILILKKNLLEIEAFKHEKYMISIFGRKDLKTGILINMTNGGDGCSGYKHDQSHIEKMKTNNPMWRDDVINKCRGRKKPLGHGEKVSKSKRKYNYIFISPNGIKYETNCSLEFCNKNNLDPSTISKVIKGKYESHKGWKVIRSEK